VKLDGDGQMPLERLPELLDPVVCGGYDYAKGNRFLLGQDLERMPALRRWGNVGLTFLTKFASGYWNVFDVQNGMTAVAARRLAQLDLDGVHDGFFFENDMLVRCNVAGLRVRDVPIPSRYGDEVSDVSLGRVALTFPWLLTQRFWWRVYRKYMLYDLSPVGVFLVLGSGLFGWGAVMSVALWAHSAATGRPTPTGTLLIALVLIVLGFQLLLEAAVLDIHASEALARPRVPEPAEEGAPVAAPAPVAAAAPVAAPAQSTVTAVAPPPVPARARRGSTSTRLTRRRANTRAGTAVAPPDA
jgi:hypothetical protein